MFGGPSGKMKVPNQTNFATVPSSRMPRSAFDRSHRIKTTGQCGFIIPYFLDEILPGDTISLRSTIFCRLLTPLYPAMDDLEIKTEYFFVPNRLIWPNFVKMMGEQTNPGDSTSYTIPQVGPAQSFATMTLGDYLLKATPTLNYGGTAGACSALPFLGYGLIYDQWYRDENIMNAISPTFNDGPYNIAGTTIALMQRAKKHDYFYSSLTQVQKGAAVPLLSGTADVIGGGTYSGTPPQLTDSAGGLGTLYFYGTSSPASRLGVQSPAAGDHPAWFTPTDPIGAYADFTTDAIDTINTLRLAATTQQFLEKDMRGGTRYTEVCLNHFGVQNPDSRLQRTEYLGGGRAPVSTTPIPATAFTSGANHTGDLGGITHSLSNQHGFTKSFTEHGHIFGMVTVRVAALTYQQGLPKMWSRKTRYDFYWPVFANLGEQAVLNKEIYYQGDAAGANHDGATWGYQERWAEYRYYPNVVTGLFRSQAASPLDAWHYAQNYASLPALNSTFLPDDSATVVDRNLNVTHSSTVAQFKLDISNRYHHARVMPVRSVPGIARL